MYHFLYPQLISLESNNGHCPYVSTICNGTLINSTHNNLPMYIRSMMWSLGCSQLVLIVTLSIGFGKICSKTAIYSIMLYILCVLYLCTVCTVCTIYSIMYVCTYVLCTTYVYVLYVLCVLCVFYVLYVHTYIHMCACCTLGML